MFQLLEQLRKLKKTTQNSVGPLDVLRKSWVNDGLPRFRNTDPNRKPEPEPKPKPYLTLRNHHRYYPYLALCFRLADKLTNPGHPNVLTDLINERAFMDSVGTAETIQNLPEGEPRRLAAGRVGEYWASRDPLGALDWAETIEDAPQKKYALAGISLGIARGVASGTIEGVQQVLNATENPELRNNVARALGASLGRNAPETLRQTALSFTEEEQSLFWQEGLFAFSEANPTGFAAYLKADPDLVNGRVFGMLANASPYDAVDFYLAEEHRFEESSIDANLLTQILCPFDIDAARAFVNKIVPGHTEDICRGEIVAYLLRRNPEVAQQEAALIRDKTIADDALRGTPRFQRRPTFPED